MHLFISEVRKELTLSIGTIIPDASGGTILGLTAISRNAFFPGKTISKEGQVCRAFKQTFLLLLFEFL